MSLSIMIRTDCPLYDSYAFAYPISLDGNSFQFEFIYNSIMKLYTLGIFDSAGRSILRGVGLTPNYPIIADYDLSGLDGFFMLENLGDPSIEFYKIYPEDLHKYYKLYYFSEPK